MPPVIKMNFPLFLLAPLFAFSLLLTPVRVYSAAVNAAQKGRSAHSKQRAQFHYVCPMHEDVSSKTPGQCRKCKMKLVRKPLTQNTGQ